MDKQTEYNSTLADKFFANFPKDKIVSYNDYWNSVKPKTDREVFQRWLFAFLSIHTGWESNVKGYQEIKEFEEWENNKELLLEKLKKSGVGLYNNRTKYIWEFKEKFWKNPKDYMLTTKKYHVKKRDSISDSLNGIGAAKTSFALCMCHPLTARTLCLDTHVLEMYGMKHLNYQTKTGFAKYKRAEQHWVRNCGKLKVGTEVARAIFWDEKQGYEDSRYWSHCLES